MSTSTIARWGAILLVLALVSADLPAQAQLQEKLRELDAAVGELYAGGSVSMERCIDVALLASSTVLAFEEDLESAGVDVTAAWAQWLPDLSITGSWSKSERTDFDSPVTAPELQPAFFFDDAGNLLLLEIDGEQAFSFGLTETGEFEDTTIFSTSSNARVSTNWTVFNGFARTAGISRAKADRTATGLNLEYQKQLLEEQVGNAYLDYVRAILKVRVAEDAEELAEKELEKSETYFELGISTRSDVLQQKVQLRNRLESVQARNEQRNTFASLAHLMNIPGAEEFEVDTDILTSMAMVVPELDGLLVVARQTRPDFQASALNVDARGKAVTEARAGFYPSISVFANYSLSENTTPFRFGAARSDNVSWGIQGQWNLFDRFQTKQQSRRAVANRRKAEYDHRQARLDLEKEIVQLRNNLIEATESHAVATQAVEQADEELRLAQERFRVGAGTSLDVINAQVGLAQARRDVVDAQTNYAKFRRQLDRASGGALD